MYLFKFSCHGQRHFSSNRGGFSAGTTSCKCHEMSSIKNVCGEGWVERGFYLPEEGEVRVRAREPLVPE